MKRASGNSFSILFTLLFFAICFGTMISFA